MPSLKETKNRIASVASTLKITSAMKMVAAAKLRKAQKARENMLSYEAELSLILLDLIGNRPLSFLHSFVDGESEGKPSVALVCFASNSSLCGGFNASVIRKALEQVRHYRDEGWDITVYSIGRRMADAMRREGLPSPRDFTALCASPEYEAAAALGDELIEGFHTSRFSRIELIHNHYKSSASQPTLLETYLPLTGTPGTAPGIPGTDPEAGDEPENDGPEFIVEPDRESEIKRLLPIVLRLKIFATLLDSVTAEHAARTVAMQMATDNAETLLAELTLEYNKSRQQKITAEILDLEGGALE